MSSSIALDSGQHTSEDKFLMLSEGNVNIRRCDGSILKRLRSWILKKLGSNYWEMHHLAMQEHEISLKTSTGTLKQPIPYSHIKQVVCSKSHFCIKIVCCKFTLLLKTTNRDQRDIWFESMQWKVCFDAYQKFFNNATMTKPPVFHELKALVTLTLNSLLCGNEMTARVFEIASELLKSGMMTKSADEIVIKTLAPLVDTNQPPYEICAFFTKHYRNSDPLVVIEKFIPIVFRVLKDCEFEKCSCTLMIDYIQALNSQNEGMEKVKKFIHDMHGPMCQCPHIRILNNFVAICLSGIYQSYVKPSDNNTSPQDGNQERNEKLELFIKIIIEIASFSDWTPGLASFLQPLPFPEEALESKEFWRLMQSVVERFAEDERESVVKCLLPIREGRGSWLEGYSPNSKLCSDEGQLFSKMVQSLMDPDIQLGKIRKFLVLLSESHLQAVMMLAVKDNLTMIKALKDMLLMSIISDEQVQLQVISALRCTKSGSDAYSEANAILMAPVNKEGPMKFQLASNSSDCDLQTLLSTGSWGNLRTLDLSFTSVTSSCVDVIKNLPNITSINLWSTRFDDAGLLMLCDSLDLTELNLCETFVTDEGIKCLEVMKNLKKLNLNSTAVSEKTFLYLKKSLPNCSFDVTYTDAWLT